MNFDPTSLMNTIMYWINEGHEAILWLSGITGLSTGVILLVLIGMGKDIARFIVNLLKFVVFVAVILFLLSLYVQTGHTLPDLASIGASLGIPSVGDFVEMGQTVTG